VVHRTQRRGSPPESGLPPLTYLTVDSVATGVGTSQVLPYVTRLADRGVRVTLHSFEAVRPPGGLVDRVRRAGVGWRPHPFRGHGAPGGIGRVLAGAAVVRGRPLVHCRSTLAAASALLGRPDAWVWDQRGFWLEQRIALGSVGRGSRQERVLRRVERAAAERSDAVVTLSTAAIDELARRYPGFERRRTTVMPTCVDLDRFRPAPLPPLDPMVVLLSGSLNDLYDAPLAVRLIDELRARAPGTVAARVLRPRGSSISAGMRALAAAGATLGSAAFEEMPGEVRAAHAGFAFLRHDVAVGAPGAVPTKVAELLASGRPAVVSAGLGDLGDLLPAHGSGVVVTGGSEAELARAATELLGLLTDPATPARCRALAEQHFDLDRAVDRLLGVYARASGET
jgi:glycosyltransferase involved in cell wall biosynthesis